MEGLHGCCWHQRPSSSQAASCDSQKSPSSQPRALCSSRTEILTPLPSLVHKLAGLWEKLPRAGVAQAPGQDLRSAPSRSIPSIPPCCWEQSQSSSQECWEGKPEGDSRGIERLGITKVKMNPGGVRLLVLFFQEKESLTRNPFLQESEAGKVGIEW